MCFLPHPLLGLLLGDIDSYVNIPNTYYCRLGYYSITISFYGY